jgi:hypothetical protein
MATKANTDTKTARWRVLLILAVIAAGLGLAVPTPASAAGTTITLDPTGERRVLTYETAYLTGTVTGGSTARLVLQRQEAGVWKDLTSTLPSPGGSFEVPFAVTEPGDYLLRMRSLHGTVVSDEIDVIVVRHPTVIRAGAYPFTPTIGQRVAVSGQVVEPTATPRVVVQRKVGNRWSDRQAGTVDSKGRFRIVIQPSEGTTYTLRVRSNGGSRWSEPFQIFVQAEPISQ